RKGPEEEPISSASRSRYSSQRKGFIYRILRCNRMQLIKLSFSNFGYRLNPCRTMADIQMQNLDACKLINVYATSSMETEMGRGTYQPLTSSPTNSSLDLEWEHEYSQLRQYQLQCQQMLNRPPPTPQKTLYASLDQLPAATAMAKIQGRHAARQARFSCHSNGGSLKRNSYCSSTHSSWSHISTPESLEWEADEEREQQRQLRLEDDNLDDRTLMLLHQIEQLSHNVLQETGRELHMERGVVNEVTEVFQFRDTQFKHDSLCKTFVS
ncbi:hypothetical protein KR084_012015, partial [Drosophila pseudotakahashii]